MGCSDWGHADQRIIGRGGAMNDQSDVASRAEAGVEHGHAADGELVNSRQNVDLAEMFQHTTRDRADHLRLGPLSPRGQQLGAVVEERR